MNKFIVFTIFVFFCGCFGGGTRRTFVFENRNVCEAVTPPSRITNVSLGSVNAPLYLDTTKINIRRNNLEIGSYQEAFWGEFPATAIKRILKNDLLCIGAHLNSGVGIMLTSELIKLEVDLTGVKPYARYEIRVSKVGSNVNLEKNFSYERELSSGDISEATEAFNSMIHTGSREIALWGAS